MSGASTSGGMSPQLLEVVERLELPRFRGQFSAFGPRAFLVPSSHIHERGFGGEAPESPVLMASLERDRRQVAER